MKALARILDAIVKIPIYLTVRLVFEQNCYGKELLLYPDVNAEVRIGANGSELHNVTSLHV